MRALLLTFVVLLVAPSAVAQTLVAERQVSWRSYAAERTARVRTFPCDDERRPTTIVVDDAASNGEPVTVDAQYVADLIAREVGVDPTAATFVFRFSPAAFTPGADDRGKTLLLRATFRRLASGGLGSPEWRVITPDALAELTDRAMR